MTISPPPPQVVTRLDPEALPVGELTRLEIELIHDGMGTPMRLPVLAVRGARGGPVLGLTAAIHGNEVNGIPIIHRLLHQVDPGRLRGTLIGAPVLNLPGFLMRQRGFNDGRDLNHLFPGREPGYASEVYVARLLERLIAPMEILIDLHTASFGRVNSLYIRADMSEPRTAQMARLLMPQIIVHNPPADGTLRGAVQARGVPAITLEIGNPHRFQSEYIGHTVAGLRAVLSALGMLPRRSRAPGEPAVLCERSYWLHTHRGGLLEVHPQVTDRVAAGDRIATLYNIYGDVVAEYPAPESGVVIGHAVDPVAQTGARILHLGIPANPDEPPFLHHEAPPP